MKCEECNDNMIIAKRDNYNCGVCGEFYSNIGYACLTCDALNEAPKLQLDGKYVCESCFAEGTAFNDKVTTINDKVNHPSHYTKGIECWDYIASHKMDFFDGSAVKYITRHKSKNGKEDLLKAMAFIKKQLKEMYKCDAESEGEDE